MADTIDVLSRVMRTIGDIIDAFGGNTVMARIIEKGPSTVSEMRRRGRIDVNYWPTLVAAASDAVLAAQDKRQPFVLTNDMLVDAHVSPIATASRPEQIQAAG